ncbi:hypothetical protein RND71_039465 [Anisodus tanguticus]|uniref:Uncharacterized protein n=1 Tax=Anisodus tanguticus TaxID=243964 RepID=A0AAE1QVX1_9SOLA|nr:hypothetical protein RND71_039465 [Anisodus tanguticus]
MKTPGKTVNFGEFEMSTISVFKSQSNIVLVIHTKIPKIRFIREEMKNNGKGKGYTREGTSNNGNVFSKKDKKSVKTMAVEKIGKVVVSSFKNDKKMINSSDDNS